jgi:hypothetical protein
MSCATLERARALTACVLLLQSLWGCATAQGVAGAPWTRTAPMPMSRSELAAAPLDGRIYVAGGIAQWGTTAAFESYDPATGRWEELPPLPEAVHHLAAAATQTTGSMSPAATPICCSARSQTAPGPTTLWHERGPGSQIFRHRGQRTVWQQSRASCTWSAAWDRTRRSSGSTTLPRVLGCCAGRAPDPARAPHRDGARRQALRRRWTVG